MGRGLTKLNGAGAKSFVQLTRKDLSGFDKRAQDLIMDAIDHGCIGRVSAKGHCILRNSSGESAAVPRNMSSPNRTAQNSRAQVRRLLAGCDDQPPA